MESVDSSADVGHRSGKGSFSSGIKQRLVGVLVALMFLNIVWFLFELFDRSDGRRESTPWPSQADAWSALGELATDGFLGETLFSHTTATLVRVVGSLGLGMIVGGGFGAAIGSLERLRNLLGPCISFLRLLTPVLLVSMLPLFIGIGSRSIVLSAGFVTVWLVADGTARAVAAGGSAVEMTERLVELARTSLLVAWVVVAFAEVTLAGVGLGSAVWSARVFGRTDMMLAVGIWSTLLFLMIDYGIRLAGRVVRD